MEKSGGQEEVPSQMSGCITGLVVGMVRGPNQNPIIGVTPGTAIGTVCWGMALVPGRGRWRLLPPKGAVSYCPIQSPLTPAVSVKGMVLLSGQRSSSPEITDLRWMVHDWRS